MSLMQNRQEMAFLTVSCRWFSNVSRYPSLDSQIAHGPTYSFEYSTRDAYGANVTGWTANDPLNATWWHHVSECP